MSTVGVMKRLIRAALSAALGLLILVGAAAAPRRLGRTGGLA